MKRITAIVSCSFLLAALAGCATSSRQPSMKEARIQPEHLEPGDTAIITVEVADRFNIVQRVEGLVKEDRTITFKLRDDGITPDKKAGDNIWTIQVDVPFNAPPDRPCRIWHQQGEEIEEIVFDVCDQYTIQGDLFAQAILNDTAVPTPIDDAVANMRVIEAIIDSHRKSGWATVVDN